MSGSHDDWHQHTAAEGMPQEEHGSQASVKALGMTFIVMTVGVIVTILLLVVYFKSYVGTYKAKVQEGTAIMQPAFEAKLAAQSKLESFGWIDRDARTVHIPIDQAMQSVINDYQNAASN
ncbi:MAG: hypothetical protein AB8F26_08880 [Phycisphaerales bacterium]